MVDYVTTVDGHQNFVLTVLEVCVVLRKHSCVDNVVNKPGFEQSYDVQNSYKMLKTGSCALPMVSF